MADEPGWLEAGVACTRTQSEGSQAHAAHKAMQRAMRRTWQTRAPPGAAP